MIAKDGYTMQQLQDKPLSKLTKVVRFFTEPFLVSTLNSDSVLKIIFKFVLLWTAGFLGLEVLFFPSALLCSSPPGDEGWGCVFRPILLSVITLIAATIIVGFQLTRTKAVLKKIMGWILMLLVVTLVIFSWYSVQSETQHAEKEIQKIEFEGLEVWK